MALRDFPWCVQLAVGVFCRGRGNDSARDPVRADGGICRSFAENLAQAWGGVTMVIKTAEEIENCKRAIFDNANETHERLKEKIRLLSATEFLEELKFDRLGADPMKGTELNFIEQLNQMFSDLVVLEGARRLLCLYPEKELRLNLGPSSGFDIESTDGEIVAECFAVTTATSNRKLEKDCSKLMSKAPAKQKYIYFYSRNDAEEKLRRIYDKYPEIVFARIANFA